MLLSLSIDSLTRSLAPAAKLIRAAQRSTAKCANNSLGYAAATATATMATATALRLLRSGFDWIRRPRVFPTVPFRAVLACVLW